MKRLTLGLGALLLLSACSSSTEPDSQPAFPSRIAVYSSNSPTGPWGTAQTVTVTGHDALGLVDPAPVRMPDGSILLYYLMSYQSTSDPATVQPNNQWKFGAARSTSPSTFTHQGIAYTHPNSAADPFPLLLDANGTIRLLFWTPGASSGATDYSVTATDTSGLHFGSLDGGFRTPVAGEPGALKIGSTYFVYLNSTYYTATDGLNFTFGGPTGTPTGHPIDAGNGTYLMAYTCTAAAPNAQTSCIASSTDGRTWTGLGTIGPGGVPGLVKDASGVLHVYVVAF